MSATSAIEWTQATLNPWTGCTKVGPGCAHCYIEHTPPFRMAGRRFARGHIPLEFHMERLEKMLSRRKPTLYFVNSLSDVFHEDVADTLIVRLFAAFACAPQHTFQCLTKRPARMQQLLSDAEFGRSVLRESKRIGIEWPLPNVWAGVTVENRRFVSRGDLLRDTPAAVRFVSAEPLLGPLIMDGGSIYPPGVAPPPDDMPGESWADGSAGPELDLTGIDWLICGGESGKGARRLDLDWARDLRDACADAGTAFFFKQLGGPRAGTRLEGLPEELRIRQYPVVA